MRVDYNFEDFFINYNKSKKYYQFKTLLSDIKNYLSNHYIFNCCMELRNNYHEYYLLGYKTYLANKNLDFINIYFKYHKNLDSLNIILTAGSYTDYNFMESMSYIYLKDLIEASQINMTFKYNFIKIEKNKINKNNKGCIAGVGVGALSGVYQCLWTGRCHAG